MSIKSGAGEVYSRARVTRVHEERKKVTVNFLDTGAEDTEVSLDRVFQLPASLGEDKFPAEAMTARLVGLRPPHSDLDWSEDCTNIVAGHLTPPENMRFVVLCCCVGRPSISILI